MPPRPRAVQSSISGPKTPITRLTASPRQAARPAARPTSRISQGVWPAYDTRLSNTAAPSITWINPQSFQIFASGLDLQYSNLTDVSSSAFFGLQFPTGGNYDPQGHTFDDITNFSGGTLESAMP